MSFKSTVIRAIGITIAVLRGCSMLSQDIPSPCKRLLLLACIASLASPCVSQENGRARYAQAYRQYLNAECPVPQDDIRHFVYFARDREAIIDHPFLNSERFSGAQIMYLWRSLEPAEGQYDFEEIRNDLEYLGSHGKKLFIQLQDATFSPKYPPAPDYLLGEEYAGGQTKQVTEDGQFAGWVCKRWNVSVRDRFSRLLEALGEEFDGRIEGINLQETAIDIDESLEPEFSPSQYAESIKANMLAMKSAFPQSVTMQYANFMPGEWLPFDDQNYLRSVFEYGDTIGVGLGSPDLMVKRLAQLNHPLAMMHERQYQVPLGIAIQDGNYVGRTGADLAPGQLEPVGSVSAVRKQKSLVPMLHAFAEEFLHVSYMFWVNQEPYFVQQVLPCIDPKAESQ
ncbi:MAG: hypothetical protein AAF664_15235 [Planctomycetota bacterium]